MDTPQGSVSNQITGNVLFYKQPQPLNHAAHGKLGVKKIDQPFDFLRTAHAVPVTISEFGTTAICYPVIFVGDDRTPVAVMGIRQGQNLYVNEDGTTDSQYYVPAFARRYPFVFAADQGNDQLLLCIDRDAQMVTDEPDVPFFEGDQPSKFTQDAIEFCKEFERQRQSTLVFRDLMIKHDMFEMKTINFQPRDAQGNDAGEQQKIADYWAVPEEKLQNLSPEAFKELHDANSLGAIYSHLVSLLNWPRVIQRAIETPLPAGNT